MASSPPSSSGALAASGSRAEQRVDEDRLRAPRLEAGQQRLRGRVALERGHDVGRVDRSADVAGVVEHHGRRTAAVAGGDEVDRGRCVGPRPRRHERVLALLAQRAPVGHPGLLAVAADLDGRAAPVARLAVAAVHRHALGAAGERRAGRLVEVGPEERAGRLPQRPPGARRRARRPGSAGARRRPTGPRSCRRCRRPQATRWSSSSSAAVVDSSQNWGMRCTHSATSTSGSHRSGPSVAAGRGGGRSPWPGRSPPPGR